MPRASRKINRNPGSRWYRENDHYEEHRGFYRKDAAGRWRTPDGRIARGQRQDDGGVYRLQRANEYNKRRASLMLAIDAVNAARDQGVPMTLNQAKRSVDESEQVEDADTRSGLVQTILDVAQDEDVDLEAVEFDTGRWGYD